MTEDLIASLLEERLKSPDCNAGVVFDNISNKLYQKEIEGVRTILKALPAQHVQLINLYYSTDVSGLEVSEIVDPARDLTSHALPLPTELPNLSSISRNDSKFQSPDADSKKKIKMSHSSVSTKKSMKRNETAQKINTSASDQVDVDRLYTFDINLPKQLTPEELETYNAKSRDLADVLLGQYKEPPPPIVEEVKKDDKSKDVKKGAKNPKEAKKEEEKSIEVSMTPEQLKIPVPNKMLVNNNNRSVIRLPVIFNHQQFNQSIVSHVPEPKFPDPDLEPVPAPENFQLVRKPGVRHAPEVSKTFNILTPKNNYINETDEDVIALEKPLEETTVSDQTRWIVPAKKKISLYVKFFTPTPGFYESAFDFECFV